MVRAGTSKTVVALACFAASAVACHPENRCATAAPVAPQGATLPGVAPRYETVNGAVEFVEHGGRSAVHLVARAEKRSSDEHLLAIIPGSNLADGTIQVDVAGAPFDPASDSRGFIGLAFHLAEGGSRFECFYLRPTNGRADDQLRRNHTTQYVSYPDFPWEKLRESNPGVYESYADIQPDVWTRLKVVVKGTTAKLFVNDAEQPVLIVSDLKLGKAGGQVALWSHATTDAYFSNLEIIAQ